MTQSERKIMMTDKQFEKFTLLLNSAIKEMHDLMIAISDLVVSNQEIVDCIATKEYTDEELGSAENPVDFDDEATHPLQYLDGTPI
jgi:hypothetical protein